jgi:hypothetical protein
MLSRNSIMEKVGERGYIRYLTQPRTETVSRGVEKQKQGLKAKISRSGNIPV